VLTNDESQSFAADGIGGDPVHRPSPAAEQHLGVGAMVIGLGGQFHGAATVTVNRQTLQARILAIQQQGRAKILAGIDAGPGRIGQSAFTS